MNASKLTPSGQRVQEEDTPTRLLVVEDDAFARLACVEFLDSLGYDVMSAETGEGALRKAQRHKPQIALCDWQLGPGMDGVEVSETLQSDYDTKIIMFSGQPLASLQESAQGINVQAFLRKPVSLAALHEAILAITL